MHRTEIDTTGIYICDLRSPLATELLDHERLVELSKSYSKGRIADLLVDDIKKGEFDRAERTVVTKKPGEKLPDSPLSLGVARELVLAQHLDEYIELIPAKEEKNKRRFNLTGERAAVAGYKWRQLEVAPGIELDTVIGLEKISREALAARQEIISANLRLVVSIAKKYPLLRQFSFNDYIGYGNIGLVHAVDKFDWRSGYEFSTYAARWIKLNISRAIDEHVPMLPVPESTLKQKKRIEKAKSELEEEGHAPSVEEVRSRLNDGVQKKYWVSEDVVRYFLERHALQEEHLSLDAPFSSGEGIIVEFMPDRLAVDPEIETVNKITFKEKLIDALMSAEELTERELEVLYARYLAIEHRVRTSVEVGHELGISYKTAQAHEQSALNKIRKGTNLNIKVKLDRPQVELSVDEILELAGSVDLSPLDKEVIELCYTCGLTTREAADKVGINYEAMKVRKRRTINKLKNAKARLAA